MIICTNLEIYTLTQNKNFMISILLAVYNGERYIRQSIESVLNQSFMDFELLIGFNGTTDQSKHIVNRYRDTRIRIFDYGHDKGKAKTLNKLIKEAKYDWCGIQDDDDIWLSNKLKKQISYIDKYDVIGTLIAYINEDNHIIGSPNLSINSSEIEHLSIKGLNQIANSSAIFKKYIVEKLNGWNEHIDGIEDYDLWLRIMRKGYVFINLPEQLVLHRIHSASNFNTKNNNLNDII
jgi:glycosyltransferase involved in cell wall biosynthesis